jgi:uncharacterized protein YpuA (DUF1002 family)
MDRRTLTYLAGGFVVLILIMLVIGLAGGGLDKALRARAEVELKNFDRDREQVAADKKGVEEALKAEAELFESQGYHARWPDRFAEIENQLNAAAQGQDKIRSLVAENDKETAGQLEDAIEKLAAARLAAISQAADMQKTAQKLLQFKRQLGDQIKRMESNYRAAKSRDLSKLEMIVAKGTSDWTEKQNDLKRRLTVLTDAVKGADQAWETTREAREAAANNKVSSTHLTQLIKAVNQLGTYRAALDHADNDLPKLIDQLYWSWDKILADMEISEDREVTFHHKYKVIKTRALAPEGEAAEQKISEHRQMVSKSTFESMKKNLGMTVEHKPAGKYDHEAERGTQPPGYAYMCQPSQHRNGYGHWDRRGGTSFWVFYGQYALMRDLFWGRRYGYVTTNHYGGYYRHRQAGRTYYGRDEMGRQRYGSNGTVTRTNYSSSKYARTDGFRNSRYVKSGGKYRGSRHETPRARTTRGASSYRSSRSSGSRSSYRGK